MNPLHRRWCDTTGWMGKKAPRQRTGGYQVLSLLAIVTNIARAMSLRRPGEKI
ncbi:hypothetical protein S1OALGB6SA_100 [Olavius algarvensis spirochete endosymbiont]|nr:hypothetical protein S1OALGB6SA_100 [Olavius algarvensis spirochete endosymbiont]